MGACHPAIGQICCRHLRCRWLTCSSSWGRRGRSGTTPGRRRIGQRRSCRRRRHASAGAAGREGARGGGGAAIPGWRYCLMVQQLRLQPYTPACPAAHRCRSCPPPAARGRDRAGFERYEIEQNSIIDKLKQQLVEQRAVCASAQARGGPLGGARRGGGCACLRGLACQKAPCRFLRSWPCCHRPMLLPCHASRRT